MAANETPESRRARIERMEAEGTLSPAQARSLLKSLTPPAGVGEGAASATSRHGQPWAAYLGLAVIALIFAGLIASLGGNGAIQDVSQTINQPGGTGEMNKTVSNMLAALLILIVPIGLFAWMYNSIVSKEEGVYASWAQVESSYQRRSDLIPSLVDTVSRYLKHEAETLGEVTRARGDLKPLVDELVEAQKASADLLGRGEGLLDDDKALAALAEAELKVGGGMRRMVALVEGYPELKASDQFLELQGQLEGTENRINVARLRFNEAVEDYNRAIRKLPGSLVAGVGRFQRKAYFKADEGTQNAPKLDFH